MMVVSNDLDNYCINDPDNCDKRSLSHDFQLMVPSS